MPSESHMSVSSTMLGRWAMGCGEAMGVMLAGMGEKGRPSGMGCEKDPGRE